MLPGMETRRPDDFELFLEGILEAPRGQREVFDGTYKAAWKNDRSASVFPCGTNTGCGKGACGNGCGNGCANGSGSAPAVTGPAATTAPAPKTAATPSLAPLPKAPLGAAETTATPLPPESAAPAALPPGIPEPSSKSDSPQ
jgi:pilus assembly protein CpaC